MESTDLQLGLVTTPFRGDVWVSGRSSIVVQIWYEQVRKIHMEDTHCPRTLFILNISILSALKIGRILSSQRISLLFDGF